MITHDLAKTGAGAYNRISFRIDSRQTDRQLRLTEELGDEDFSVERNVQNSLH